jgi:YfiH family protein
VPLSPTVTESHGYGHPGWSQRIAGVAALRCSDRATGDLAGDGPEVEGRRRSLVDLPWTRLRQVHGAGVVHVRGRGDGVGVEADAAVTASPGVALAVLTADCAPVALASPEGVIGVAHAGWRGLLAGVLEATVAAMADLGASRIEAVVGPCIEVACYEWSAADLAAAVGRFGPAIEGRSATGAPAFDLPAGVSAALRRAGVVSVTGPTVCTACSADHWSWRAGHDLQRQATVAWLT